jgi:acyl-coenzyme A thioesterase PaaI-like protein
MSHPAQTHLQIDPTLCGEPVNLEKGRATVAFETTEQMRVDERGLVHGGFVFGLADYAAMLAVNDPNVVLGAAESRFTAPVTVGQRVEASAHVTEDSGAKRVVEARASVGDKEVFRATFTAFVLDEHVLDAQ